MNCTGCEARREYLRKMYDDYKAGLQATINKLRGVTAEQSADRADEPTATTTGTEPTGDDTDA